MRASREHHTKDNRTICELIDLRYGGSGKHKCFDRRILITENRIFERILTIGTEYFKIENHRAWQICCVCGWRKTLLRVGQKEKLLGAQDQRLVCDGIERWPERLLNITANYITTLLEAPHQRNHQSETFTSKSSSAG